MSILITFRHVSLSFGIHPLLDNVNLSIERGERICLIGRNGTGKSTLLNCIQGIQQPDSGEINRGQGVKIHALPQEVPTDITGTVFEVVLSGLGEIGQLVSDYETILQQTDLNEKALATLHTLQAKIEQHNAWAIQNQAHTIISRLGLDGNLEFSSLSGGLKRRVLLAKALVCEPDILLLDEPTNHLDIDAVEWLEQFLPKYPGSILFITHDRAFLQKLATRIIELDRGHLMSFNGTYQAFLAHKATELQAEAQKNALFDKKLAQEEAWIRQGIKARRTRNEGRVRALEQMRRDRQARRNALGKASSITMSGHNERIGKRLLMANHICFDYQDKHIINAFSTEIWRGDKIGILGPNGCGKSTLLNLLLGKLTPTKGNIERRNDLTIAYFDQLGRELDDQLSIAENIGEGSEYVEPNGQKKHIFAYLQDFLFTPERARSPISALSGGERNRVLLAKMLSKPSDILVFDEPTNDLDIETLELLETALVNYVGTVLLVSHDRVFIDNIVTSTIVFEGNDQLQEYVGGYQDWLRQRQPTLETPILNTIEETLSQKTMHKPKKLSFAQKQKLAALPDEIEALEASLENITEKMSRAEFYQQSTDVIKATQDELKTTEQQLADAFALWETLSFLEEQ